jgi:ADP-ribosyl-[dinitrogen reductase] hydrolase
MPIKTSSTHPLLINTIHLNKIKTLETINGCLGLTFCPGKKHKGMYGDWDRDFAIDLQSIQTWGADVWVNTMEDKDMASVQIDPLFFEHAIKQANVDYIRFPVIDGFIPDEAATTQWKDELSPLLQAYLKAGKKILIHCRGGLGRTGTIAVRLLVDLGIEPKNAIEIVRDHRNGAIENSYQEDWVSKIKKI